MEKLTRRELLRRAVAAGSASVFSTFLGQRTAIAQSNPLLPQSANPQTFSYFTSPEITFLNAAVERLIPTDNLGPGARDAGVVYFIDQQMASPFGRAERWYMQGPWREGTKEQGYQLKLTPAQLYRTGIRGVDDYCRTKFSGKVFSALDAATQDNLLQSLDKGEVQIAEAPAKEFFDMLLQNTMEGFLADPMYGGNRNFAGWKLIGFPGPRYNYVEEIEQHGKRYTQPVVGLAGRNGTITRKG